MAVPIIVDDGDFDIPQQNGADEYSLPFFDRGDGVSWEVKRKMRVASASYIRPKLMRKVKTKFGNAYLVEASDPSEAGNALVEWTETFASLPETRTEGGSIAYSVQFLSTQAVYDFADAPASPEVSEMPLTLACDFVWEYFLDRPAPLISPRVAVINGTIFRLGDFGTFIAGNPVVAEDSEVGIYKGGIYYRKTPYVRFPQFVRS